MTNKKKHICSISFSPLCLRFAFFVCSFCRNFQLPAAACKCVVHSLCRSQFKCDFIWTEPSMHMHIALFFYLWLFIASVFVYESCSLYPSWKCFFIVFRPYLSLSFVVIFMHCVFWGGLHTNIGIVLDSLLGWLVRFVY